MKVSELQAVLGVGTKAVRTWLSVPIGEGVCVCVGGLQRGRGGGLVWKVADKAKPRLLNKPSGTGR